MERGDGNIAGEKVGRQSGSSEWNIRSLAQYGNATYRCT